MQFPFQDLNPDSHNTLPRVCQHTRLQTRDYLTIGNSTPVCRCWKVPPVGEPVGVTQGVFCIFTIRRVFCPLINFNTDSHSSVMESPKSPGESTVSTHSTPHMYLYTSSVTLITMDSFLNFETTGDSSSEEDRMITRQMCERWVRVCSLIVTIEYQSQSKPYTGLRHPKKRCWMASAGSMPSWN